MGYQGLATHSKTKFKNKCLLKIRLGISIRNSPVLQGIPTPEHWNTGIIKTLEPWNTGIIKTSEQRAEV
jgi:hypothetical protein